MFFRKYWIFPITTLVLSTSPFLFERNEVFADTQGAAAAVGAASTAGTTSTAGTAGAADSDDTSEIEAFLPKPLNIAQLLTDAGKGDAQAQLYLGMCYALGEGVTQDDKQALKWLQLSAAQKNYQAQYILSLWCMNGHIVTKNEEMGLKLLLSAANGGFAEAQYEYASYLSEKEKQDEASVWMKKAAEQGYVPAETALGAYLTATSEAGSEKMQEGMSWLILAAMEGDTDAQTTLGACFIEQKENVPGVVWLEVALLNGDKTGAEVLKTLEPTPDECFDIGYTFLLGDGYIPKNYDRFKYWTGKAAEKGQISAQFILGMYYVSGINHELTPEKGTALLEKAADGDFAEAQLLLGVCYRNGTGVAKDDKKAIEYLQKAAKLKNANAFTQLGFCSLLGIGIVSNEETTKKLFAKAAEMKDPTAIALTDYCTKSNLSYVSGPALLKQLASDAKTGNAAAQYIMGEIYADGCGVKRDDKTAAAYYNLAVKQNHPAALAALSWYYEMGIYVIENRDTAIQLAMKAAEQGDAEALSYLNTIGQVEAAEDTQKK